ncbi:thiamine phosphate synthase [Reinekea sp.]|uniref:thiamine phosphate synthase n=1 Tax=Reinekea sp. TaxID=1970455 RepID=UPI003988C23B
MLTIKKKLLIISGFEANGFAGAVRDVQVASALGVSASMLITTLTAQNSNHMSANHAVPADVITKQLNSLLIAPQVLKIGVLPNREVSISIATWLNKFSDKKPYVILDPVRLNSGDHLAFASENLLSVIEPLLPFVDLLTPNLAELGTLVSQVDHSLSAEEVISQFFKMQPVFQGKLLVKGVMETLPLAHSIDILGTALGTDNFTYFSQRKHSLNMRGTGCLLSTAIGCALCEDHPVESAIALASAYLAQEFKAHEDSVHPSNLLPKTDWPDNIHYFPKVNHNISVPIQDSPFQPLTITQGLYPIVDSSTWVAKLAALGVKTIQLRIKNESMKEITTEIRRAIEISRQYSLQLFINDYWQIAIEHGAYGVHLGQEDLQSANLASIQAAGIRLGVSTHGDYEFLIAHQLRPSYIAVGAIYPTQTKDMSGKIQGLQRLKRYCQMTGTTPIVAIGGINLSNVEDVLKAKPSFIAVVSAITKSPTPSDTTQNFLHVLR